MRKQDDMISLEDGYTAEDLVNRSMFSVTLYVLRLILI